MADKKGAPKKKKVIFVVEDDLFLIRAYQIKFEKEGFEVWVATEGNTAMEFLKKDPADVVLLDLMLPGVSGFDILEEIRRNAKWKNVPVIILTNLGQQQDINKGAELKVKDYIVKANVKISDVVEKVKGYIK